MLTEVLLEVTDIEVSKIAESVYKAERKRAARGMYVRGSPSI